MNKKIKVAIQGYKGSYTHQILEKVFKKNKIDYILSENETFHDAFESLRKNGIGLIPIENSTAGFVEPVIDELISDDFEIVGETFLDINHTFLVNKEVKDIKEIKKAYSHYQALLQTSDFLKKNKIKAVDIGDTAGGAKYIKENKILDGGAIGSEILAEIYDLKILAKKINNEENNKTRFFLIRKKGKFKEIEEKIRFKNRKYKTSLIFKTRHISGALYKALGGFATNDVNLRALISRPVKNNPFDYKFYVEFDGKIDDKKVQAALNELEFFSEKIIYLGSYREM